MRLLTQNEVCERALRKIGATAIRSAGSRAEEMAEARYWLDMVIGHLGARKRTWWLVQKTGTFPLLPNVPTYDLNAALGPNLAPGGVQFVVGVWISTPQNLGPNAYPPVGVSDYPSSPGLTYPTDAANDVGTWEANGELHLPMLAREEWQGVQTPQLGTPQFCYVDRQAKPTISFSPVPDTGGPYTANVIFQSYTPDFVSPIGNTNMAPLRQSWNLCIVSLLAKQLGNGPIRKLPKDEVDEMRREADQLLFDLEAYDDMEQADPKRAVFYNGV